MQCAGINRHEAGNVKDPQKGVANRSAPSFALHTARCAAKRCACMIPVPQTGAWLRSVVQGYFNYYALPGDLDRLGLFRERILRFWGQARLSAVVKDTGTRLGPSSQAGRAMASSTSCAPSPAAGPLRRHSSKIGAACASERSCSRRASRLCSVAQFTRSAGRLWARRERHGGRVGIRRSRR